MEGYKAQPHNVEKVSRRAVLGGLTSVAALASMGKMGIDLYHSDQAQVAVSETDDVTVPVEQEFAQELMAEDLESPVFDKVLAARTIEMGGLRRDQVLFIDALGQQLSEPVTLTESLGRSVDDMTWRFEAGSAVGITGAWIAEQKAQVSTKSGVPVTDIGMLHVYQDLDNTDQEFMSSKVEAAYANAVMSEPHDPDGRSAVSIVRAECRFPNIPEPLATELQSAMIGIACEESRFKAGKKSDKGALGLLQVMPDNITAFADKHGLHDPDPENLSLQIGVAIEHIELTYHALTTKLSDELHYFTEVYFRGNSASMEKYLLLPLIINSYNCGQERMIDVVEWFTDNYLEPDQAAAILGQAATLSGYDVYQAMVYQCDVAHGVNRFGDDSSNYVERVMGWERAFTAYEIKLVTEAVVLAQN